MDSKKPWLSKTLWINLIMAIAAFFPPVQAYVAAHPETLLVAFSVVNIILRLVTKGAIQIGDDSKLP